MLTWGTLASGPRGRPSSTCCRQRPAGLSCPAAAPRSPGGPRRAAASPTPACTPACCWQRGCYRWERLPAGTNGAGHSCPLPHGVRLCACPKQWWDEPAPQLCKESPSLQRTGMSMGAGLDQTTERECGNRAARAAIRLRTSGKSWMLSAVVTSGSRISLLSTMPSSVVWLLLASSHHLFRKFCAGSEPRTKMKEGDILRSASSFSCDPGQQHAQLGSVP